ncbi:MAG TPA: Bax inhibitor-1/YccA family protein, partial [Pseudolysinimonas sp.]|nr:Bax inhibitor-1/YccA family protein [Pseudolysinimonas sp.]
MANPAFSNSPAFSTAAAAKLAARQNAAPAVPTPGQLQEHFSLPDATPDQMERMTYQDTIFKTLAGFAVLLVGAAIGWVFPILAIVGLVAGLVLALVNIFKKKPSPGLILAYAFAEGLLVGGVSMFFSQMWDGIVPMAVLGTLGVVGVTLALFANGKVRVSKRATQVFLVAIVGYMAFSLINVVLMMTGVVDSFGGMRDFEIPIFGGIPLGIPLGILVVLLAAY